MPRENSFSDSDGRSLTPDLEEELQDDFLSPVSPTYGGHQSPPHPVNASSPVRPSATAAAVSSSASVRSTPRVPLPFRTPQEKFRSTVRKVIQLHRGTSYLSAARGQIGAEPGVDPRRASANITYGHIKQDCVIEVADYSAVRSSFGRMTNREFVSLLNDAGASAREPWVKVRWINVGGISWDVISAIAMKYELHPLALEDVLHQRGQSRSKVDYYNRHLFLRVLCHELGSESDFVPTQAAAFGSTLTDMPRSSSPDQIGDEEATIYGMDSQKTQKKHSLLPHHRHDLAKHNMNPKRRLSELAQIQSDAREKRINEEIAIEELKKHDRVLVNVKPMYIFLLRDGTVISMHPTPGLDFTAPITARLRQRDTGLRSSADPSLLVQSLLDLIVDQALEVIDAYANQIRKFEKEILLKSKMKTVRALHVLSGDLILHKRTLEPIKTILYGLRRYDLDRCAALVDTSTAAPGTKIPIVGYMTHKSKIYLADVHDHMEYILTSVDMFSSIAENLIDYSFNMASYEMNETMRRLTLITIIFLPLTLLTGYFGMNFEVFWAITDKSDLVFWIIALPMMAVFLPLALFGDIRKMVLYIRKKIGTRQAVKAYKQA